MGAHRTGGVVDIPTLRKVSLEGVVGLVILLVGGVGGFFVIKTSQEYDERHIYQIEQRIQALEVRERDDRDILIRLDNHVLVLNGKMDTVLDAVVRSRQR